MSEKASFDEALRIANEIAQMTEVPLTADGFDYLITAPLAAIGWTPAELTAESNRRFEFRKKWWTTHLYDSTGLSE